MLIIWEILLLSFGVAMDATTVSICKGSTMGERKPINLFILPFLFGLFQFVMPYLGSIVGEAFAEMLHPYDHYVALLLLLYIGGSMIYNSIWGKEKEGEEVDLDWKEMLLLAIATSIDALAIGATLPLMEFPVLHACILMGIITFVCSFLGALFGKTLGKYLGNKSEILGGIILCVIGIKVVIG